MVRLSDFLERFRPAGVPGAAAPAGVPADYAADRAAELDPVFSALTEVRAACASERLRAEHRAEETRERARAQAAAIVSAARLDAGVERAQAVADIRQRSDKESSAVMRSADLAADGIRRRSAARMPEEVARVVAKIRSLAGDPP
ncbi:hypothetical protein AB0B56_34690 [Streptosporangium canum]|uniref:Uncharacterized protein n=1 Tax=Streptosporangium canum TaxID=324952 RepID=A0A1I3UYI6_9ACTN|nr:hypothetical protein [Streptosporangium canum]SFJ87962.1 hypothetical protein SAMN05216275_113145 [Streptosporangium canum]